MCLDWITSENVKAFANSNFFTALVGSAAGAFAGAYAAQRIVERGKIRDEFIKELRSTNAAIMLSFNICNAMLASKKQHVQRLKEEFDAAREGLLKFQQNKEGQTGGEYQFKADLESLPTSRQPTDVLQKQVLDNLSVVGRPLSLITTLVDVVSLLGEAIQKRNKLIEEFKAMPAERRPELPSLYFGLPNGGGHVNQEYATALESIYRYTDDAIFFSQLLCRDLNEHGNALLAAFKKRFRGAAPSVSRPDFAKAYEAGLMPPDENYADWTSAFVKKPTQE